MRRRTSNEETQRGKDREKEGGIDQKRKLEMIEGGKEGVILLKIIK